MQHLGEWPLWHDDDRRDGQLANASLRHEIALARYLERQREHRQTGMPIVDLESVALRLLAFAMRIGSAFTRRAEKRTSVPPAHPWGPAGHLPH
ncbi:hypothetical protein EN852_010670 [Mesorhizobium sp. M2E.F.Ca.ET.209.01.1.1]|uniref:hypothetical protein n=1 Tax=Mesorhizobium sp. M2E.F.Ca.ET.209.01.1.1 TaxID=2500526 RepID=UPI000FDADB53|nr:hypothetical protein [Mesorhizobium sp. M2E.F.Ca.ET.209.01.1.1]TGS16076.1 hypothetical protein EN852_010670 [Mesorhizobium sp. M2E.F.Ca.ET.209.01.1.1]